MADTPFSFHCMICFEEFHPDGRYPVVLPCGHTYVCNTCADRIDVCMECREPLYTLVPRKTPGSNGALPSSNWSATRSRGPHSRTAHESPPQPPTRKRLPLPKNVVLLSLIEATELASRDARGKQGESPKHDSGDDGELLAIKRDTSMIDAEVDEDEKIQMGTSLAVGVAGTYAVAAREGLQIFPSRPSEEITMDGSNATTDEDVDTLVRFFHLDSKSNDGGSIIGVNGDTGTLGFGDRVQVVAFERGWAKLARGYGYVRANNNQLVKVGGAVDKSCKLEGMLRTLSLRRRDLRLEQTKIDNQFIRLMNELQISLHNDEDLTVILADAFESPPSEEQTFEMSEQAALPPVEERNDTSWQGPSKHGQVERQSFNDSQIRFNCFAGGVFDMDDSRGVRGRFMDLAEHTATLFPSSSNPSPSAMRAGAQAWRDRHGHRATDGDESTNGIDFRTGMSGHMALLSSHAHPHEYLEDDTQSSVNVAPPTAAFQPTTNNSQLNRPRGQSREVGTRGFPKMSSHMGLSMSKFKPYQFLGLALPSLNTSPRSTASAEATVPQTNSM